MVAPHGDPLKYSILRNGLAHTTHLTLQCVDFRLGHVPRPKCVYIQIISFVDCTCLCGIGQSILKIFKGAFVLELNPCSRVHVLLSLSSFAGTRTISIGLPLFLF